MQRVRANKHFCSLKFNSWSTSYERQKIAKKANSTSLIVQTKEVLSWNARKCCLDLETIVWKSIFRSTKDLSWTHFLEIYLR